VIELEHGIYRPSRRNKPPSAAAIWRRSSPPSQRNPLPYIGHVVAQVDEEARKQGLVIPFADLLIGGTALHFGYGLVIRNERHFHMIPNLPVHSF
jgi:predicted nucleic acid-binding protein